MLAKFPLVGERLFTGFTAEDESAPALGAKFAGIQCLCFVERAFRVGTENIVSILHRRTSYGSIAQRGGNGAGTRLPRPFIRRKMSKDERR